MKALVRTNITEPVQALGDISFTVNPGEIVAVVGPNGAGKTTTFRILVGLTTPTKGSAAVMGYDSTNESVAVRSLVGWMPGDDRSMLMRLTCTQNLLFHGRLQGLKGRDLDRRITDMLQLVGLGHAANKTIFALSAGMRARIQLARALLHDPAILVLDEPTGAVDPVAAHGLLALITGIEALESRVILLDKGMIRYHSDLRTLRERLDRPCLEIEFARPELADIASNLVRSTNLTSSASISDGTVQFILEPGAPAGSVLSVLTDLLPEVTRVDEFQRPLRDLLAEIYDTSNETEVVDDPQLNGAGKRRKRRWHRS